MIIDILFYILGSFVFIISNALALFNYVIPDNIGNAITYFVAHLSYLQGLLPISTLITVIGSYLTFLGLFYSVKLALWAFSLIPWFGKKVDLPELGTNKSNLTTKWTSKKAGGISYIGKK